MRAVNRFATAINALLALLLLVTPCTTKLIKNHACAANHSLRVPAVRSCPEATLDNRKRKVFHKLEARMAGCALTS